MTNLESLLRNYSPSLVKNRSGFISTGDGASLIISYQGAQMSDDNLKDKNKYITPEQQQKNREYIQQQTNRITAKSYNLKPLVTKKINQEKSDDKKTNTGTVISMAEYRERKKNQSKKSN